MAFDIGTGTGVIAAVLARRGVKKIIATDISDNALLLCSRESPILKLDQCIELQKHDLFPPSRADLIVCNPPWLPAKPSSAIEYAIYDPGSQMLKSFLGGLKDHLTEHGEASLIMSDLAEHLGLRQQNELWQWIEDAGLFLSSANSIYDLVMAKAKTKKILLFKARSKEITSLWRLRLHQAKSNWFTSTFKKMPFESGIFISNTETSAIFVFNYCSWNQTCTRHCCDKHSTKI